MAPAGCCLKIDVDRLIALVFPVAHGPVEPLSVAAALLALVLGLVAVGFDIHPRLIARPAGKGSFEGCILSASSFVVHVVLGDDSRIGETAWRCKMSSKRAVVEDLDGSSWFETVNFVSALAMPPDLGIPLRTSCSAGRSAGLDSFVLSFAQTKAGDYYRNWNTEGKFFSSEEWLFGRRCDRCSWCVVGDSSRKVGLGSLRSIMMLCAVCICRASQLVE